MIICCGRHQGSVEGRSNGRKEEPLGYGSPVEKDLAEQAPAFLEALGRLGEEGHTQTAADLLQGGVQGAEGPGPSERVVRAAASLGLGSQRGAWGPQAVGTADLRAEDYVGGGVRGAQGAELTQQMKEARAAQRTI